MDDKKGGRAKREGEKRRKRKETEMEGKRQVKGDKAGEI